MDERTTLLVRTHLDSVSMVDEYQKLQAENEKLKGELKQTEAQDQVVIDGLRHALWMARALRARDEKHHYGVLAGFLGFNKEAQRRVLRKGLKWENVEHKCCEKAKEFE